MNTDQIRKQIVLRAPRQRVWEAITDSSKFGTWFGCEFDDPFAAGARLRGRVVATKVDAEAAKAQEPYVGQLFDLLVDRVEPMERFSFRWHPGDVEDLARSDEEMTDVTFELAEAPGGILLTITESGFDRIPLERRARVFEMNDGGWTGQTKLIEKYLQHAA